MAKQRTDQRLEDRRAPVASSEKERMLAILSRREDALAAISKHLEPSHFYVHERPMAFFYATLKEWYETHGYLPVREDMHADVQARLETDIEGMPDDQQEYLGNLIEYCYDIPTENFTAGNTRWAGMIAQRMVEESIVNDLYRRLNDPASRPSDLPYLLSRMQDRVREVEGLATGRRTVPFPEGWQPTPLRARSTGIGWLNDYLRVGHAGKETYGLLGPYGSCKTLTLVQLSIESAKSEYESWDLDRENGLERPLPVVYYATYEQPVDPAILVRGLAYEGGVPTDTLEDFADWSIFSTAEDPASFKPYELTKFADELAQGLRVPGELERLRAAQATLNRNWMALDMSGGDESMIGWSNQLTEGLAAAIRADQAARGEGYCVGAVLIDYASAVAERHIAARGLDHSEMRHFVGRLPLRAKQHIGIPFDCPVWIAHQLSGEQNAKTRAFVQHHANSAEARNFGENCDFCFCYGTVYKETYIAINCSKARRNRRREPKVLRIMGEWARLIETGNQYVIDPASSRIVERSTFDSVVDADSFDMGSPPEPQEVRVSDDHVG